MVSKHIELTTFDEVAEVLDGEVHCQELLIECAVPGFRRTELSREVGNRLPPITHLLLQDRSDCPIGRISHNACRSMWFRVGKKCGIGQGFLDSSESRCGFIIPDELLLTHCIEGLQNRGTVGNEAVVEIDQAEGNSRSWRCKFGCGKLRMSRIFSSRGLCLVRRLGVLENQGGELRTHSWQH